MRNHLLTIFSILLLSSCANYKLNIVKDHNHEAQPDPNLKLTHTMYLIGDGGNAPLGGQPRPLKYLEEQLKTEGKNSSVIFLGDNIYPDGLPPKNDPERELMEHRINVQMDVLKGFKGEAFITPGNHDWRPGLKTMKRQEKYVKNYVEAHDDINLKWLPEDGCSGPEVVELNDFLVVIFVDSHWWLMDWNNEPELNDGCDNKSKLNFMYYFEEAVKKHRHKNIVIAMHHPMYSNGPHGGKFTAIEYIFPFTQTTEDPKIQHYFPFPPLGIIANFFRATVGIRHDIAHPELKALRSGMLARTRKNGSFIFAAGHEHNLQYFEKKDQFFIISGAGSKTSAAKLGNDAQFVYGEQGYSVLKFYEDGTTWLEFWSFVGEKKGKREEFKKVYQKKIKGPLATFEIQDQLSFPEYEEDKKSVTVALDETKKRSGLYRAIWGNHYRATYQTSLDVPVLDLATFRGGTKAVKRGGGYQTNSLRLEDSEGQQFVMRSMIKDASKIVPYPFNKTFAKDIFADQFSAAHPYAAFVIPPLAKAARIYHTNPSLYYVPKQPSLGLYNDGFGGELYLIEERGAGNWKDLESFGNTEKILSTPDVIEKMTKNHKHKTDQQFTVRNRLFDNLIGDWDRHDDQWRWAAFKDKETDRTTYKAIPRDRDQPFVKYDGLVPALLRPTIPFLKQLRVYDEEIPNIKWLNYHAKWFDPTFVNEAAWPIWEREAKALQAHLTDEIIEDAIKTWPEDVYKLNGEDIIRKLKARRDNLVGTARDLYLLNARKVDIIGTDKHEYFEVERLSNSATRVRVYPSNKKGEKDTTNVFYDRTFLYDETAEVRLYGLDNEDRFHISGDVENGILVRCIGGADNDYFTDESNVSGFSKRTKVYDSKKGNKLDLGREGRNLTSDNSIFNTYDRRSHDYEFNHAIPIPQISFNPDDGLNTGFAVLFTTYGFKKNPYATSHLISGQYSFATSAYAFEYSGEFIETVGKLDFVVDARYQGPLFTRNYFGPGNLTEDPEEERGFNYNRAREELLGIYPALRKRMGKNFQLSLTGSLESIKLEDDMNRFVNLENAESIGIRPEAFDNLKFGGGEFSFDYLNVDNAAMPTIGVLFNGKAGWKKNIDESDRSFGYLEGNFGLYYGNKTIVLASRVGGGHRIGDIEFYQGITLGAANLRGFREQRFNGHSAFYHNTDLRLRLGTVKGYVMPFTIGVYGGYDYGRVWADIEEDFDGWHQSYGGGLWISPFDIATINFSFFHSDDGNRFEIMGGFLF